MDPRLPPIVPTPKFDRKKMSSATVVPAEKQGKETTYPFQWLLFKPQSHAVAPFPTNQQSRLTNQDRVQ